MKEQFLKRLQERRDKWCSIIARAKSRIAWAEENISNIDAEIEIIEEVIPGEEFCIRCMMEDLL